MSISQNFPAISPSLSLNFARSKILDPRITFSRTSTATRVNETGLIEVMSADEPRFDHKYENGVVKSLGLLIEEQRTNSIRNNTMVGAVAGTPGTVPAYWSPSSSGNGITREVVGTGTEDGIPYIDFKYSGTPTAGGALFINFDLISASASQTWTISSYVKVVAGSLANTATTLSLITSNAGVGIENLGQSLTAGGTDLRSSRQIYTATFSASTITDVQPRIRIGYTVGSPIDITLRIGLPQLEQGAFATSVIPTEGSTKTRNPDNVSMTGTNFSDWYNQDEGTVYVSQKLRAVQDDSRNNFVYLISSGSGNDYFYNTKHGNQHIFVFGGGGTSYSRFQDGTDSTDSKTAWAYDVSGDDFKPYYNGIEATNETDNNTPSATSHTQLELGATATDKYCGHISQLTYYPRRLTNAQLQNLTK